MIWSWLIPRTNKAVEFTLLSPLLGDWGFTILDAEIDMYWKGDHAPSFRIGLIMLHINVFEFHVYDTRHEEDR